MPQWAILCVGSDALAAGVVHDDRALARAHQAHDGAQRGGTARTIAAEQRDDLAAVHGQVDTMQDVRFAVPGVQVLDLERGRAHAVFSCVRV